MINRPPAQEDFSAFKIRWVLIVNLVIVLLAYLLAEWAIAKNKKNIDKLWQSNLSTIRTTTQEALDIWVSNQKQSLKNIASDPEVLALAEKQLFLYKRNDDYQVSGAQIALREIFTRLLNVGQNKGLFIISPDGINIASIKSTKLGKENIVYKKNKAIFDKALYGRTVFVLPMFAEESTDESVNISGKNVPSVMFILTPLIDVEGKVFSVLAERLDPLDEYSKILKLGRIGQSGETYVINKDAKMISQSRFTNQLVDIGMIEENTQNILAIDIKSPITKQLTKAAQSAILEETSSDLNGYHDYRGVDVIGSWAWNKQINAAVVSEIDLAEGYQVFYNTRDTIYIVLGVLVLLTILVSTLIVLLSNRANENLSKVNKSLESRVLARTEALEQSKVLAEQASVAKSEFLASMSHELRTPMNGVLGMLGLVLESSLNSDQNKKLSVAQDSANSLLTILNDILDFSKIEAGKIEIESIDFDIRNLLEKIIKSFAYRAEELGIELILDVNLIEQSRVKSDPTRIRQIITNLLGNAMKFTAEGEVLCKASITGDSMQGYQFTCQIIDTGIGIPEEKISKLFDSFSQVDSSTTRKYGGTGLGLTICKKLSVLLGGDVRVTSELNKGSEFTLSIPIEESDGEKHLLPYLDMKNLGILIIDDNETNRNIFAEQLTSWGANIFEAENSGEALATLTNQSNNIAIALVDMHMPNMNGLELCQKIRNEKKYQHIKLSLMTSLTEINKKEELIDIGINGFFSKPVTLTDLHDGLSLMVTEGAELLGEGELVTSSYLNAYQHEPDVPDIKNRNAKILLVEDNRINQMVMKGVLDKLGLSCDIAINGIDALKQLKAHQVQYYDIVFMDCQMPGMDGYEATTAIRAGRGGDHNKTLTIVALTAHALTTEKQKCTDAGMDDYMSKPLDKELLVEKLVKYIGYH